MLKTKTMLLSLALLGGCTSLAGDWEGELDCGEGLVDLAFNLESDGDSIYSGKGEITAEGDSCKMTFDIEVEAEQMSGEQDLEVDLTNGKYECEGETMDIEFDDIAKAQWDGEDNIAWEQEGGCESEVERND